MENPIGRSADRFPLLTLLFAMFAATMATEKTSAPPFHYALYRSGTLTINSSVVEKNAAGGEKNWDALDVEGANRHDIRQAGHLNPFTAGGVFDTTTNTSTYTPTSPGIGKVNVQLNVRDDVKTKTVSDKFDVRTA